jgi:hypothetical protein
MTNLLDKPEFEELRQDLDTKLTVSLDKIGDDFRPRDHYLQKWNLVLDERNMTINYRDFNKGMGVVQSPALK